MSCRNFIIKELHFLHWLSECNGTAVQSSVDQKTKPWISMQNGAHKIGNVCWVNTDSPVADFYLHPHLVIAMSSFTTKNSRRGRMKVSLSLLVPGQTVSRGPPGYWLVWGWQNKTNLLGKTAGHESSKDSRTRLTTQRRGRHGQTIWAFVSPNARFLCRAGAANTLFNIKLISPGYRDIITNIE